MATINVVFTNAGCGGCGKVKYNGNSVTFGATVALAAGGVVEFKPKKKHCNKKFTISVLNQAAADTLTLTRKGAVTSVLAGTSAAFEQCKCVSYTVGIIDL
jgi:hypothetical protein